MSEILPPQLPAWLCVPEAPLPACRSWDASARVSRPKPVQVSLRPESSRPRRRCSCLTWSRLLCVNSINREGDKALSVFCKRYSSQMISLPPQP